MGNGRKLSRARRAGRKRIAVVTGTRAEYGLLQSTLQALQAARGVELQVVATGMHLLPAFGRTVRQIAADGFMIAAQVPMQRGDDRALDQAEGVSRGVAGLAHAFDRLKTDVVVVLGDRIEAFAAAVAARTTGRMLAHIHGGDVAPGDFDGPLRDAITQLADLHFPATPAARKRVLQLGAAPQRTWCVGAPGLDRLREILAAGAPKKSDASYALVVQHAYGRPPSTERRTMSAILDAVAQAGLRRVIIHPNSDRGHRGVVAAIHAHMHRDPFSAEWHNSVPRDAFLGALCAARVLIGNSSCGLIEAPFAGTPSVNVGARQQGREIGGPGVLHAAESPPAIRRALHQALQLRPRRGARTVYGDGRAGVRIAARLMAPD